MTVYLDTSVAISLFLEDDHSRRAQLWARPEQRIVVSLWTLTEFTSALSFMIRKGAVAPEASARAEKRFDRWSAAGRLVDLDPDAFEEARRLMRRHRRLRAPDALHLAVAKLAGLGLATFDLDLADAARAEGMEVVDL